MYADKAKRSSRLHAGGSQAILINLSRTLRQKFGPVSRPPDLAGSASPSVVAPIDLGREVLEQNRPNEHQAVLRYSIPVNAVLNDNPAIGICT